jgi:hypothetical protein
LEASRLQIKSSLASLATMGFLQAFRFLLEGRFAFCNPIVRSTLSA